MAAPPRIIRLDEIDNTNDEVRRRAAAGETPPFWLYARRQLAGRGRRGRAWTSIEGNLLASGVYRLACPPAEAAQLTFAASLAIAEMLDAYVAPARIAVKWPNDVLIDDRKVAGVLLESSATPRGVELVVGCGVNLVAAPQGIDRATICVVDALSWRAERAPSAQEACARLVERFEHWRAVWGRDTFAPLREAWLERAAGRGLPIAARLAEGLVEGVFEDLDADGALILNAGGERRRVRAGEVIFPNAGETA